MDGTCNNKTQFYIVNILIIDYSNVTSYYINIMQINEIKKRPIVQIIVINYLFYL